ncbi:hypothetical protein CERZMDRAFT_91906 [Cercospora zeae-maydis SCOH1-5]|uniref:Uncharacterized protein n=1 Tax=Cercospora zeae-maydis SCOH1-5 TaxID=717836 RepID=A0A6A6EX62_9PEZI|nr:hypothetical protein CERZMDRAFT_91906 [Cercospora zeae-maydis SCOH1-5]
MLGLLLTKPQADACAPHQRSRVCRYPAVYDASSNYMNDNSDLDSSSAQTKLGFELFR